MSGGCASCAGGCSRSWTSRSTRCSPRARTVRSTWSPPWRCRCRPWSSANCSASPYEDHGRFEEWAWAIMNHDISDEDRGVAHYELDRYVDGLVTAKEHEPGDDMISRLIEFNRRTPAVEHPDIVSMSKLMLVTGHETTANMIALGVLALLEHPDQLAAVRAGAGADAEGGGGTAAVLLHLRRGHRAGRPGGHRAGRGHHPGRRGHPAAEQRGQPRRAGLPRPPTGSTYAARPAATSRSATASTSASARTWRAWSWTSCTPRCSGGSRRCAWPRRSRSCGSRDDAIVYGLYELPVTW